MRLVKCLQQLPPDLLLQRTQQWLLIVLIFTISMYEIVPVKTVDVTVRLLLKNKSDSDQTNNLHPYIRYTKSVAFGFVVVVISVLWIAVSYQVPPTVVFCRSLPAKSAAAFPIVFAGISMHKMVSETIYLTTTACGVWFHRTFIPLDHCVLSSFFNDYLQILTCNELRSGFC